MQFVSVTMLKATFGLFCVVGVVVSSPTRPNNGIRIVGGRDINITEAPYQVSLVSGGRHLCGGALIDVDLVATAAHCVINSSPSQFQVRTGSTSSRYGGDLIQVADFAVHPGFTFSGMDSDIALLQLVTSVEFSDTQKAVELCAADEEIEIGDYTIVTGWGFTKESGGVLPESLQMVSVPTVSEATCKAAYEPFYRITKNMLCAGFPVGGKDACQGDSGGPLVYNNKLVGVVSWGIGCARPRYPGVYSKISALRGWIDENKAFLRSKTILRGPLFS